MIVLASSICYLWGSNKHVYGIGERVVDKELQSRRYKAQGTTLLLVVDFDCRRTSKLSSVEMIRCSLALGTGSLKLVSRQGGLSRDGWKPLQTRHRLCGAYFKQHNQCIRGGAFQRPVFGNSLGLMQSRSLCYETSGRLFDRAQQRFQPRFHSSGAALSIRTFGKKFSGEGSHGGIEKAQSMGRQGVQRMKDVRDIGVTRVKEASTKGRSRIKALVSEYGLLAVGTYIGVYIFTLTGLFLLTSYNILPKGNVEQIFEYVGLQQNFQLARDKVKDYFGSLLADDHPDGEELDEEAKKKKDAKITDYVNSAVTAWLLCKVLEPLRLIITVGTVPMLAKLLKRR